MSEDVFPNFRTNVGECEGRQEKCGAEGCPLFGTLTKASRDGGRRVRGCGDPVAIGRRNKAKGRKAQAKASTLLGIPKSALRPGHEELTMGAVRWEHKEGVQSKPVLTRFILSEAQSEAARPIGDHRPFVATFSHAGRQVVVFDLNDAPEVAAALVQQFGMVL